MKKLTKIFRSIVAIGLSFVLVSCGSSNGGNDSEQAATNDEGTMASGEFSWDMEKDTTIKVMLSQHPYAEAIIKKIPDFEEKTGIKVDYSITPEENYFDKVTTALSSKTGDPDIFMTGAYQLWEYAPPGYMEPLDDYINNPSLTDSAYDFEDFYPGVIGALKWDLKTGNPTGTGNTWALPLGFEQYVLAYNKRIFEEKGLTPPKTISELQTLCEELNEFDGKGSYALALRGTRNWATIHPGYMSTYATYGAKDFSVEGDKLVSQVNSPEAVQMTDDWVKLIKTGGSPSWSSYTWYQASADFGAGKAAMLYDADVVEYFQNPPEASKEAGNIAWVPAPLPDGATESKSNLWTWSIGMNSASKNKNASWLFLQYFTGPEYQLWAAVNSDGINPARKSVFENPEFIEIVSQADGYVDTFNKTIDNSTIQFTPQPYFFQTTTEWASTLQDLVANKYSSTQEGMDKLKEKTDKIVSDIVIK